MSYYYRIREVRMFNPDHPVFIIQRTYQSRLSIILGLADWYDLQTSHSFSTLEAAKKEVLNLIKADQEHAIWRKKTKTRYHYL